MVVVIEKGLTKEDIQKAREEYRTYIKVTADLAKQIIAIGGEYHADAEIVLIEKFGSESRNIWGGGYNIELKQFETNALINIRQPNNTSMEIIDPEARSAFLAFVSEKLKNIETYL
ncbi:hypothetical protein CO180_02955 [candidate division WWE3 bacterium CG_4_9_14_3_um_filter_41_6]|uniref:Uncharacterized protein n=1 Tax=candidate division WWE3 bacterium CG_4_10_14_0_2_um_filter_41_14 TaxID=1975072 RepID=A0A2M7TLJ4_UNCKA|nr:MAG: hypothetical protein COY32_00780 [candidate division WWE3 bacterium CG_4_10_14_0_2_um_filter_41_14]PJA38666.1 MAG: hypothetical protein CO180_02955 [candidate division WWE3 bacterium CG_4_9_14_3_um_filter_41_6]